MSWEAYKEVLFKLISSVQHVQILFHSTEKQNLQPWQKFVAGGLAGATSQIVIYPMEVFHSCVLN